MQIIKFKKLPVSELSSVFESLIDLKINRQHTSTAFQINVAIHCAISGIICNMDYQQSSNKTISILRGHAARTDENSFWTRAKRRTTARTALRRSHPREHPRAQYTVYTPLSNQEDIPSSPSRVLLFAINAKRRWKIARMGMVIHSHNHTE